VDELGRRPAGVVHASVAHGVPGMFLPMPRN
jgi:hypothetical protein